MPTYAYACTECEHRFDAVQSFSDPSLTDCPQCSGRLRKLFSAVGIVFKGSGFYRTDSRAQNGSNGSKPKAGDAKTADAKTGDAKTGSDKANGSGGSREPATAAARPNSSSSGTTTT